MHKLFLQLIHQYFPSSTRANDNCTGYWIVNRNSDTCMHGCVGSEENRAPHATAKCVIYAKSNLAYSGYCHIHNYTI